MIYLCLFVTLSTAVEYSTIQTTHQNNVGGYWQMQIHNNQTSQFIQSFSGLMGTFRGITSFVNLSNNQVLVRLYGKNSRFQAILNKYTSPDNAINLPRIEYQFQDGYQASIKLTISKIPNFNEYEIIEANTTKITFNIQEANSQLQRKNSNRMQSYQKALNQVIKNESILVYLNKISKKVEIRSEQCKLIIASFPKISITQIIVITNLVLLCAFMGFLVDYNEMINSLDYFQPRLEMTNIILALYALQHFIEWNKSTDNYKEITVLITLQTIIIIILGATMFLVFIPFFHFCRRKDKEFYPKTNFLYKYVFYRSLVLCSITLVDNFNIYAILLAFIFEIYQQIDTKIRYKITFRLQICYLLSVIVFIAYYTYLNTLTIMKIPFDDRIQLPLLISVFVAETIFIIQNYTKFLKLSYRKYKTACRRYYIHLKCARKGYKKGNEFCCLCLERLPQDQIEFEMESGINISKMGKENKILTANCNHVMHRQCLRKNKEIAQCPIDSNEWGEEMTSEYK